MNYLKEHLPQKEQPSRLLKSARQAIVFAVPYTHPRFEDKTFPLTHLKVAKYARGSDYHFWLREKARQMCADLKHLFPDEDFAGFTDSSPIMERDLAYRAGLGWFGKNSCILSRTHGSFFLLAEIYTSLSFDETVSTLPDHCGTCRRCIDSCPTGAILENRTLDAHKCISYWTIEAKAPPPEKLRSSFQSWFFGCDICQDVCPWNVRLTRPKVEQPPSREGLVAELRWILTASNKELEKAFAGTPLTRARGRGLKRNALIVAANQKLTELKHDIERWHAHPELGELAHWTTSHLDWTP